MASDSAPPGQRTLTLPLSARLYPHRLAPDGSGVVVQDYGRPRPWWLIDDRGHLQRLATPPGGDEPLLVWRREGRPELVMPEGAEAISTHDDAVEYASAIYVGSAKCSE